MLKYKPLDSGLAVKHHLMHHFLKSFYSYKNGVPAWEVRRTPTLNYWRKKFSNKPIVCHEAEVEFLTVADGENSDVDTLETVSIYVIPYHLTTNVILTLFAKLEMIYLCFRAIQISILSDI